MDYRTLLAGLAATLALLLSPLNSGLAQQGGPTTPIDSVRALKAARWDALVAGGMDPDAATATVEREFGVRTRVPAESLSPAELDRLWREYQASKTAGSANFDTVGARAAGYTDAEIRLFLDSLTFSQAGFTAAEIRTYLDSVRLTMDRRRPLSEIADETIGKPRGSAPESTAIKVGRWLWVVPLSAFAGLLWSAFRASRLKAWVGALHWGQLLILCPVLFFAGFLPVGIGLLLADALPGIGVGQEWALGLIPLGPVAALLVLWWWFGARGRNS